MDFVPDFLTDIALTKPGMIEHYNMIIFVYSRKSPKINLI